MGITAELYERLDRAAVLQKLDPIDKGETFSLLCPECNQREAYIYKNGSHIKCNRANKCNYSAPLFEYIQNSKGFSNNKQVIEYLAEITGYQLDLKNYDEQKQADKISREKTLEKALTYFKESLKGPKVDKFLESRGYKKEEADLMDLGFLESLKGLRQHLGDSVNIVSILNDTRIEGRIVIPYRDYIGRLQGFTFRALDGSEPKYLNSKGLKTSEQFFNLDKNRTKKILIISEGFLDSLITTARGLKGFVSIGKAQASEAQIDNAIKAGVKHFVLALDNDPAGIKGTQKTLEMINKKGGRGYVLPLPEGFKDIDEYLKENRTEELEILVSDPKSGVKWQTESLLSKHSKQGLTDIGRDQALEEALAYEETLIDPIDSRDFLTIITEGLDIPFDDLKPLVKDYRDKKAKAEQEKAYKALQFKAARLLNEGKIEELGQLYKEEGPGIATKRVSQVITPYLLDGFIEEIKAKKKGLKTGFKDLDKRITIPQEALTIIAGRPSHGKTTLKLNILLNCIDKYSDKRFFFFSYEETKSQLALKCLNILSGEQLDQYKNLEEIESYIKENKNDKSEIERGKQLFKTYTDTGRLWLVDEPYYIDDLTNTILYLAEKYDNIGAVFIDYIQKIKIKGNYQSRQVEIQKVSEELLEVSKKAHLPIILGAQFNRAAQEKASLANLRESGDIEQDANLVLSVYNEAIEEMENSETEFTDPNIDLEIRILKNRGGVTGKQTVLNFHRPTLKISDKEN